MMHTRSIHFKYEAIYFHTKMETASEVSSSQTELVIQRKREDKLKIARFEFYKENQVKDFACSFSKLTDQLNQSIEKTRHLANEKLNFSKSNLIKTAGRMKLSKKVYLPKNNVLNCNDHSSAAHQSML